jgi:hypothetical protein
LTQYAFQMDGYWSSNHSEILAVVPEPSLRTTGTILRAGSARPGFSALISGSFHWVMTPVKILAIV